MRILFDTVIVFGLISCPFWIEALVWTVSKWVI